MKPVDEMTLEEVLQEVYAGQYPDLDAVSGEWRANGPHGFRRRIDTLDAAAELPEGWVVNMTLKVGVVSDTELCQVDAMNAHGAFIATSADTELLARFRLRLAVLRATKKGASDGLTEYRLEAKA